jgi:hypothetical protein
MRSPCDDCPFTRGPRAIRLSAERVDEIAGNMLSPGGSTFSCHKTVEHDDDDEPIQTDAVHCAGALIFAEKNGNTTQMMRIAERLRLYDHRRLTRRDTVFDTIDEMRATAHDRRPGRRPARTRRKP